MIRELLRSKRRLLAVAILCVVLVAALAVLWHGGQVAEAAVLDPHPGLVGWWRFDEGVGSVAKDSSGYGNDGTVHGATWVDGKYGNALSFDGVDDYVSLASAISIGSGNATVEAWVYKQDTSDGAVFGRTAPPGRGYIFFFWINNAYLYVGDNAGLAEVFWDVSAFNFVDQWHHLLVTKNDDTLELFVDGVSQGTKTLAIMSDVEALAVSESVHPLYGLIDEARIYNRVISPAEIQESFQKGPDFSSRLLAKVPKGTTQLIVTLSWQGEGSINTTIESPSKIYTEDMVLMYQRTTYSSSSGDMLNIKRLAISVTALSSDENWYVVLEFDDVEDYRITVEVQR